MLCSIGSFLFSLLSTNLNQLSCMPEREYLQITHHARIRTLHHLFVPAFAGQPLGEKKEAVDDLAGLSTLYPAVRPLLPPRWMPQMGDADGATALSRSSSW